MNYKDMIGKIQKAKDDYYNYGTSQLTDQEYDQLVAQAEKLGYVETVGASPVDSIKKIKHEHPMLSLNKCHSAVEVIKFAKGKDIVAMWKADGLTCSATYMNGVLVRLETRGDGKIGNDVMFHADSIKNLPKRIDKKGRYVIDGEMVILWSDFNKMSNEYSHPRNLAAGSLNQLDPNISAKRHLRFYAWDVIEGGDNSLLQNLVEAHELGFDTVDKMCVNWNDPYYMSATIDVMKTSAEEANFPIDGIVFKFDDVAYGKSLGGTAHHMNSGIAFKFADDTYPTTLKEVIWQVGKSGQITPVATFQPVEIDGSIVEKASLHNLSIMKKVLGNNPYVGQKIWVAKMNMIIPQIVKSIGYKGEIYEI